MPLLEIDDLSYTYANTGGLPPVSLTADAGDCVLVDGPSGSGKSTLSRCIGGLIPHLYRGVMEGTVTVNGRNTRDTPLVELSREVGLVFQNPVSQMLASSVEDEIAWGLENLGLPTAEMERRIDAALTDFGLEALRSRLPQALSAGEQQKVALASIMAREPQLLVLDEPLSMLDPESAQSLASAIASLPQQGRAVVACEHREYLEHQLEPTKRLALPGNGPGMPSSLAEVPLSGAGDFSVSIDGLECSYGDRSALRDIRFTLEAGEVVGLVGRNGAGKTTLLRCLMGVQEHTGEVCLSGGKAPKLKMVPQDPNTVIFNPTVRDEILYGAESCDIPFFDWLVDALGLEASLGRQPLLLSEGQKVRVTIASCLVNPPQHALLTDDPTLGQDDRHKAILGGLLGKLSQSGIATLLATHDLSFLMRFVPRIVLLDEGEIVADGPTAQILGDRDLCRRHGIPIPEFLRGHLA